MQLAICLYGVSHSPSLREALVSEAVCPDAIYADARFSDAAGVFVWLFISTRIEAGFIQLMSTQRLSDAPSLSETSPLKHTVALRAKCDGYHISTTNILNKHGSALIVSSNPDTEVRSMMEFDVSSLPAASVILRAALQVYVTDCRLAMPDEAMTLCCYGYIGNGNIALDDSGAGRIAGVSTLTHSRLTGPMCLNLAPEFVLRARETGYAGFRLETSASALTAHPNCLFLRSLESVHPDSAPMLFIDYTVPTAAADLCVVASRQDMAP